MSRVGPEATEAWSRSLCVDGVRTHFLDAGSEPECVVLLHGGDFGAAAALTWGALVEHLSPHYRVVAPDLLGYGATDKLRDFVDHRARIKGHLRAFLRLLCIEHCALVGVSLGGRLALELAAAVPADIDVWSVVAISSAPPDRRSAAFKTLSAYDGTRASYRSSLAVTVADERLVDIPEFFEPRFRMSRVPGAWECARAATLRLGPEVALAAASSPPSEAANHANHAQAAGPAPIFDTIAYDRLMMPVLFVQGAEDRLGNTDYAGRAAGLTKDGRAHLIEHCGHSPQVEQPEVLNALVGAHLARAERSSAE